MHIISRGPQKLTIFRKYTRRGYDHLRYKPILAATRICVLVVVVVAVGYISGGEALLRQAILTKSADMQI